MLNNFEIFLKKFFFAPFRMLILFIKSFVNPFVDIALTFSSSSFNSFLLEVTFLFKFFSLLSNSVFFTKIAISCLLAKFACANLEVIYFQFH